jgi:hypothetical protein
MAREFVPKASGSSQLPEEARRLLTTDRKICAVHLDAQRNGFGTISHIPPGSQISVLGGGFNERTLRMSWQNELYFVFREDVGIETTAPSLG